MSQRSAGERSHLSIGEVLSLLQDEFPDVTISKIRFLESQGLLDPERTPSGYRKFYEGDVRRLRWILTEQRDSFLPLKVIRERLAEGLRAERAAEDPSGNGAAAAVPRDVDGDVDGAVEDEGPRGGVDDDGSAEDSAAANQDLDAAPGVGPAAGSGAPSNEAETTADRGGVSGEDDTGTRELSSPPEPPSPAETPGAADTSSAADTSAAQTPAAAAEPEAPPPDPVPPPIWMVDAARAKVDRGRGRSAQVGDGPDPLDRGPTTVSLTLDELLAASGLDAAQLASLEEYGLVPGHQVGADRCYDGDDLVIAQKAAVFLAHGVEARHLRLFKTTAEREAALYEQLVMPLMRGRQPEARAQARATVAELAGLGQGLRAALLRAALPPHVS